MCDLCKKAIIAMYPADAFFPVYCRECWYSDNWDPLAHGRDYDFSKSFLAQFSELQKAVPRINLQVSNSVNSDFSNQIANCKNCYLISSGSDNEDCRYCFRVLYSKNLTDCLIVLRCENAYECIECLGSSRVAFTEDCANSLDMLFSFDVRSSQNCFMSANLRRASYVFRGECLSKEEYESRRKEIDTGSHKVIEELKKEFSRLKNKALHRFANERNCVNSVGHTMSNAKDCFWCFNVADVENCRYCLFLNDAKDTMDVNNGCCNMELFYEVCTAGLKSSNAKFCVDAWPEVRNIEYCDTCRGGSHDLFGCISLRGKEYCILNRQYPKDEYFRLVDKIKKQMDEMAYVDKRGITYRYGEFFPSELSPFPYNDSVAQDLFTLAQEEIVVRGLRYREAAEKNYAITQKSEDLPDHIRSIDASILKETIGCAHESKCNERCTKAFRITAEELGFYQKFNLPLPRLCPNCRHYQRFKKRNPLNLWRRKCQCAGAKSENSIYKNTATHFHGVGGCPNEFETSYAPERPEIVYCEQCYNTEVV
ncbi:MAG: hypothetical protein A2939_04965 [Parcubacteria group bacterium RIFCSPLOWO2_01_FULL_48_18]|nr:MAG: hypothetical protein A2939_04965 [Parcubacteria group bacterium RIFCSPLOWO2_01_FULL_48_18]OHB24237.1 MAG: hypothetical protein A3J67_05420 [Parcubacteria group bacterium RIFCSPHIGHO2_02_FULL_48_10b]